MLMDGSYRRTMERSGPSLTPRLRAQRSARSSVERSPTNSQRGTLDSEDRCAVAGSAAPIRCARDCASALPSLGARQGLGEDSLGTRARFAGARRPGSARVFYRRHVCAGKKRGLDVGKTKRGKGCKVMAIADRHGLPVALCTTSASPAEVTLVATTVDERFVADVPERLIGDKAYDSDPLDETLLHQYGIEMIAPNRSNRRAENQTQDGRSLRRYRRRWKIERLFAWLGNFRRLVVRYEYHSDNYLGFLHLGCAVILLRYL